MGTAGEGLPLRDRVCLGIEGFAEGSGTTAEEEVSLFFFLFFVPLKIDNPPFGEDTAQCVGREISSV